MTNHFFLLSAILCLGTVGALENSLTPSQQLGIEIEKMHGYLHPSQIFFSENSIFVSLDGNLKQVDTITSDANGLQLVFPSGKSDWQCPKCDYINHKSAKFCDNCLWDPKRDPINRFLSNITN